MPDSSKDQERAELHRAIWSIANDLRGSVDSWDFKAYVLGMLFYRYISENLAAYINAGEREAGDASFDYAELSDSDAEQAREDMVKTKGFLSCRAGCLKTCVAARQMMQTSTKRLNAYSGILEHRRDETRRFIDSSFRDGALKTTGTDIDKILPLFIHLF
ncbi:hypothetical protein AGMMS49974_10420 [Deltaproteobacteria bacterium]|nr:hypothetical protein AGMMS49974_10420 [Deltaproteobacteria bacterium]